MNTNKLLPHQIEGVNFAMSRLGALIADDMGLGKTIQAIEVLNRSGARKCIIVCPSSLRLNWLHELREWLDLDLSVSVVFSGKSPSDFDADICIVSYDLLPKYTNLIESIKYDVAILDEAHYIKNPKAKRTKACKEIRCSRKIALTGTPVLNRPVELWPILQWLDPATYPQKKFMSFAKKFCAARQKTIRGRKVWDFSGASNLDILRDFLFRTILIRRTKDTVLNLPPKIRQIVPLYISDSGWMGDLKGSAKGEELLEAFYKRDYARAAALLEAEIFGFENLARIRREIAESKIDYIIGYLKDLFDVDPSRKIVLFAHHRDVLEAIHFAFPDTSLLLYGGIGSTRAGEVVREFQNNPSKTLLCGNFQSAGVGHTLTASSHIVFAELDWVPANLLQAEDRCYRIGQKNSTLIQYLISEGSLEGHILRTILYKLRIQDALLG